MGAGQSTEGSISLLDSWTLESWASIIFMTVASMPSTCLEFSKKLNSSILKESKIRKVRDRKTLKGDGWDWLTTLPPAMPVSPCKWKHQFHLTSPLAHQVYWDRMYLSELLRAHGVCLPELRISKLLVSSPSVKSKSKCFCGPVEISPHLFYHLYTLNKCCQSSAKLLWEIEKNCMTLPSRLRSILLERGRFASRFESNFGNLTSTFTLPTNTFV